MSALLRVGFYALMFLLFVFLPAIAHTLGGSP